MQSSEEMLTLIKKWVPADKVNDVINTLVRLGKMKWPESLPKPSKQQLPVEKKISNVTKSRDVVSDPNCACPVIPFSLGNGLLPSSAIITNVTADGTTVTFTSNNNFVPGTIVNITGVNSNPANVFNLTGVIVTSATATQFTILNSATGTYISGGLASVDAIPNSDGSFGTFVISSPGNYVLQNSPKCKLQDLEHLILM